MDSYEKRRKELEAANRPLLHAFHEHLFKKRVGKKKSADHVDNLAFFANEYLLNYEELPLAENYDGINFFLGDWFIRKCAWANEASLAEYIDTFRKFYDFLHLDGRIDQARHQELHQLIDDSKATWLRHLRRYNDPSIDIEDVWDDGEFDEPEETEPRGARHFVIMLSGRAAKHFKVRTQTLPKTDELDEESHWMDCWRCELIAEHRPSKTVYFLLTNAETLFSMVIPNSDRRIESLVSYLSQLLAREVARLRPDIQLQEGGTFRIVRGQPRSLIGSQNELLRFTLDLFNTPNPSLETIHKKLNHLPMLTLESIFPDDAFKKQLEAEPPTAPSPSMKIIPFPPPAAN
ncbi:hypothetical protein ACFQY0_11720 [Haloferula chungangensis]|uniref:Site-specific integrase n=1 Tax=Haloferula chungangensis TaxID=1048331 RepID=A0ABW2L630_9BACT